MFRRLALIAILAVSCTLAQDEGGGGSPGGGGGGGGRGGGGGGDFGGGGGGGGMARKLSKLEQFAEKLKIQNKEQGPEVEKILTAAMNEAAPIRQQLDRGRAALTESIINKKGDDDFKKNQDMYATVVAQLTMVEAKAFAQVLSVLKDNQKGKAAQAFELLDGYFDEAQPMGGGGRGRGMGGGGGRGRGGR
jgi:hypothetical protein